MGAFKDLSGQVFTRLTVLERVKSQGPPRWRCQCECGGVSVVTGGHLNSGMVRSCGCLRRENGENLRGKRPKSWRHGLMKHPLYRVWAGLCRRCENPKERSFEYYGARGVKVCEAWRHAPEAFIAWALERGWTPENRLVVARRGDAGDYSPENCEMISKSENWRQALVGITARRKIRARAHRGPALFASARDFGRRSSYAGREALELPDR